MLVWLVGLPCYKIGLCVQPFSLQQFSWQHHLLQMCFSVIQIFQPFPWQQTLLLSKTKKPPPLVLFALCFLYLDPGCRGSGQLAWRRCLICSILCSLLWGMPSINTTNPPPQSPDEPLPKSDTSATHSILPSQTQPAKRRPSSINPIPPSNPLANPPNHET